MESSHQQQQPQSVSIPPWNSSRRFQIMGAKCSIFGLPALPQASSKRERMMRNLNKWKNGEKQTPHLRMEFTNNIWPTLLSWAKSVLIQKLIILAYCSNYTNSVTIWASSSIYLSTECAFQCSTYFSTQDNKMSCCFILACGLMLCHFPLQMSLAVSWLRVTQRCNYGLIDHHRAAPLPSWIKFNCLQFATVGKVAMLLICWQDAACRSVIP